MSTFPAETFNSIIHLPESPHVLDPNVPDPPILVSFLNALGYGVVRHNTSESFL